MFPESAVCNLLNICSSSLELDFSQFTVRTYCNFMFLAYLQECEHRTKLNAMIQFPLEGLDMRRHLESPEGDESFSESGDCVYDLYAVCNHSGTLQGGHYIGNNYFTLYIFNSREIYYTDWTFWQAIGHCRFSFHYFLAIKNVSLIWHDVELRSEVNANYLDLEFTSCVDLNWLPTILPKSVFGFTFFFLMNTSCGVQIISY